MRPSTRLRRMLDEPENIVLSCAHDALTARQPPGMVEAIRGGKLYREVGADVVYIGAHRSLEQGGDQPW